MAHLESASTQPAAFTVADLLRTPPCADAQVLAAADAVPERAAEWISVLEWPIEDFVQPGEVVLTTGAGCWPRRMAQLIEDVIEAGAACVCVALPPDGEIQEVPPRALDVARRDGVPVVLLPWKVRFSDVIRAFVDGSLSRRYGSADGGIAGAFTRALLGESGLEAMAAELERMLARGALVLDARLQPAAAGPLARRAIDLEAVGARARELAAPERAAVERLLDSPEPISLPGAPAIGLEAITVVAARARHRSLGYVVAVDGDARPLPALAHAALGHAATAVAIEMLRAETGRRASLTARSEALWTLARDELSDPAQVAAVATRLGLSTQAEYEVAAGAVPGGVADERARAALGISEALAAVEPRALVAASGGDLLVLWPAAGGGHGRLRAAVEELPGADWGISDRPVQVAGVPQGWQGARRALAVGRALHGPGAVGDGRALGPFLLLHGLGRDAEAQRLAHAVLEPLVQYDAQTSRDFLTTLEVFLAENGNGTAAARRLFLNRHSLAYRLRKIEELTGRSLADHDDRFLLELSLRMLRL